MEERNQTKIKPFVKWVGGKSQVLDIINLLKPNKINKFIEPFVGGGAVFFSFTHNQAIINDINKELIITYRVIKNYYQDLINILDEWNENEDLKGFYQELKLQDINSLTKNQIAARLIFLNKYGFNGIYRVNSKGAFNVPFAKRSKTNLYDTDNIINVSNYLKNNKIKILNNDYQKLLKYVEVDDFLFVDPPYYFSDSKRFNSYNVNRFTEEDQRKLFKFLQAVEKKGANWLLTNNNDPFIRDLYQNYFYFSKKTNRFINADGKNRIDAAEEIFILNYKLDSGVGEMLPKEAQKEIAFTEFCNTLTLTNNKLNDFVEWNKVEKNVLDYKHDLLAFNLLHSEDEKELKTKIAKYWKQNLDSYKKFYLLLAVRKDSSFIHDHENYSFRDLSFKNANEVIEFLKDTNLIQLFIGGDKIDFSSYMRGIEVGLDSNSRKNRYGKTMKNVIQQILSDNEIQFERNVVLNYVKSDESELSKKSTKHFDFKFTKNGKDYYLMCNFYNSSGSKLNEATKSYIEINKILQQQNINFIWVTDGAGWKSAKANLRRAFSEIENLFSIKLFKQWIIEK